MEPQQKAKVGLSMKFSRPDPHFRYFDGGAPQAPSAHSVFALNSAKLRAILSNHLCPVIGHFTAN